MIAEALQFPFFQRALAAGLLASVACGIVGSLVAVKRISSISGGLSHAAFGGVGLGYLLGFDPMIGAAGFALAAGGAIGWVYRRFRSGLDTLISMVWAVGMALGILFVSLSPGYAPDLMSYLFGSILLVPSNYVTFIVVLDAVILVVLLAMFRELRAVAFDEEYAEVVGVPVGFVFQVMLALTSLAVVTLIRVVGVILVIALLTIPAVAARQWAENLKWMMFLAVLFGAASTCSGLFLSYWLSARFAIEAPTGPLIILLAMALYGASVLLRSILARKEE